VIPAPCNIHAIFQVPAPSGDHTHEAHVRVLAFDDHGEPMILGPDGLMPAREFEDGDFVHLRVADERPHVVDGGGFLAHIDGNDTPVLGWVIDDDAHGFAVISDDAGGTMPIWMVDSKVVVHHPDHPWSPGAIDDEEADE
jgi:hypothetical protein